MNGPLHNRKQAGQLLARKLAAMQDWPKDSIVMGLPRGGVVVAFEIAKALKLELDVCLVRKLGVPWQPELAMGAIATGGVTVLHKDVIRELGITRQEIEREAALERRELDRRDKAYRQGRPAPELSGRTVIVVDDGIATGSTVEAAIRALRQQGVRRIVLAVGVAPPSTAARLAREADEVVCVIEPESLASIGQWYEDFEQVTDAEVRELLARSGAVAAT